MASFLVFLLLIISKLLKQVSLYLALGLGMTAKLTFYGGVDEIGGNKILLQTEDGSVLLDFGRRMGEYGKFFQSSFKRGPRMPYGIC